MQELKTIAKSLVNLFYPLHCFGCGKPLEAQNKFRLCGHCIASVKYNAMPPFWLEGLPAKAYSACLYEGTLKELIHLFKYKGKTALVKVFAKFMIDCVKENPEDLASVDMITVVPLHKKRLRERAFNQSLLLANQISKEFSIPLVNILEKTRHTKYQNELPKSERLVNLKGAFTLCGKALPEGQKILLVDDVMTTGATLSECAKALLGGSAGNVTCFTLARGI